MKTTTKTLARLFKAEKYLILAKDDLRPFLAPLNSSIYTKANDPHLLASQHIQMALDYIGATLKQLK